MGHLLGGSMVGLMVTSFKLLWWSLMETSFILLGSKITSDGDYSHEFKRCLLLGRITMVNLDNILKCRDITLLTKVRIVEAMVFPAVMYGCERWT